MVSAIVLIAFGFWLFYERFRARDERGKKVNAKSRVDTFCMFLGLTLLNPITVVYFTTLILGLTAGRIASPIEILFFVVGAFSASLSWQTLLALISGLAHKRLSPRLKSATFALGNCVVILLGILILIGIPI
jgi:arginine exporter protein ArgO